MAGQRVNNRHTMGLRLRVPFSLVLLLVVSAAQGKSVLGGDDDIPRLEEVPGRKSADYFACELHPTEEGDSRPLTYQQFMAKKAAIPERSNPICSACEKFTNEAVSYLSEKQTQDDIVEILHDACSQTFSLERKCVELVDSYATLLFAKVTEVNPDEFCKKYGLCREIVLLSGVKSDSTCVFCHQLLDEILSKLKDPDAEFEIIQLLIKECNKIQGHVQECKRMVLQYVPLVLANGEKFLEKKDVCALVQACDATQKRSLGSFLDGALWSDV